MGCAPKREKDSQQSSAPSSHEAERCGAARCDSGVSERCTRGWRASGPCRSRLPHAPPEQTARYIQRLELEEQFKMLFWIMCEQA